MIDAEDRVKLIDFGIAAKAGARRLTFGNLSNIMGTAEYISPERVKGKRGDARSDLYALGLVLYEVFTGKKAFEATNLAELHRKQSETNPTPPSSVVKNIDRAVERAILRCLDRDPSQRPRSAHAVAASLPGGDPVR